LLGNKSRWELGQDSQDADMSQPVTKYPVLRGFCHTSDCQKKVQKVFEDPV